MIQEGPVEGVISSKRLNEVRKWIKYTAGGRVFQEEEKVTQNRLEEITRDRIIDKNNKSILWINIYQWSSSEIDVFLDIVENS